MLLCKATHTQIGHKSCAAKRDFTTFRMTVLITEPCSFFEQVQACNDMGTGQRDAAVAAHVWQSWRLDKPTQQTHVVDTFCNRVFVFQ